MMRPTLLIITLVLGLVVTGTRTAEACGVWTMRDSAKGHTIKYLINSMAVHRTAKGGKAGRRVASLYFDEDAKSGLRVLVKGRPVLDVQGEQLVRRGKPVGTVRATGEVTIGKHTFTIALTPVPPVHDMPTWKLEVRQGDQVIVTSDEASALCRGNSLAGPGDVDAAAEDEVRRRVVYYLAWRVLGAP